MGNVLTDGNGNVLLSNNNALEVTSAIDSNIQAGNIKKDVTILGVTGTYEGSGGGGFKCTNKMLGNGDLVWAGDYSYQYTFNGTLQEAGIGIIGWGGGPLAVVDTPNLEVTYSTLNFSDIHSSSGGISYDGHYKATLISPSLTFTDNRYYNVNVSISNSGLLTFTQNINGDEDCGSYSLIILFRGTDGNIDYDLIHADMLGMMD